MATEGVQAITDTLVRYSNPVVVSHHPERPVSVSVEMLYKLPLNFYCLIINNNNR